MNEKKIICLAGPTGAGKSAIAARLAQALDAEIINADSRQVYADFPIITAQPNREELAACPHHLYGFLPTEQKISAGQYAKLAEASLDKLLARGKTAILVGGTGLYFRTLLQGLADIPQVDKNIHKSLQERLLQEGSPALHHELSAIDPLYAAKIHPNDRQRVTRALEVFAATGRSFSWWHQHSRPGGAYKYIYIGIGLPLAELEPRLSARIDLMLEAGALEEAQAALRKCTDPQAPGWSGIGCAELYQVLQGGLGLEEAKELWRRNTRAYAKRQLTWFRAEPTLQWFRPEDYAGVLETARADLQL